MTSQPNLSQGSVNHREYPMVSESLTITAQSAPSGTRTRSGNNPAPYVRGRPRRTRRNSVKSGETCVTESQVLEINEVKAILSAQKSYEGGVNCHICGKLYKSRVCFIKHIWEHTVYWDVFQGVKNHDRVLSIQAAIILCSLLKNAGRACCVDSNINLLVASPHSSDKRIEDKEQDVILSSQAHMPALEKSKINVTNSNVKGSSYEEKAENNEKNQLMKDLPVSHSSWGEATSSLSSCFSPPPKSHLMFSSLREALRCDVSERLHNSPDCSDAELLSVKHSPLRRRMAQVEMDEGDLKENNFVSPVKRKRED